MDDSLFFDESHLATREMVRAFAREEVAPVAAKLDADAKFPWDNIRKMADLGLLGVPWPEEYGGAGGGTRTTGVKGGNCYVINGTRRFITQGGVGEFFVVPAVTDPTAGTKG